MKQIIVIFASVFIFNLSYSYAGAGGKNNGNPFSQIDPSKIGPGGQFNIDQFQTGSQSDVLRKLREAQIAYKLGQNGNTIKFQVAKSSPNGDWDINTIQGPANKLNPSLKDALKASEQLKQWQKIDFNIQP